MSSKHDESNTDLIRGKGVQEAVNLLEATPRGVAARHLRKVLKSAIANAENRDQNVDVGKLYVKEVFVNGGPSLKRIQANTMGRAFRILKRQSHITIKLDTRKGAKAAAAPAGKSAPAARKQGLKPAAGATAKPSSKAAGRSQGGPNRRRW